MVRREIKSFTLTVGDLSRECAVPCSVRSVFGAESEIIGSRAVFETNIYVDEVALAMKNFYLRVKGISSPAAVYLGDSKILDADGVTPVYNVDLAPFVCKGDNSLRVVFDRDTVGSLEYTGLSASFELIRFSAAIIDRVELSQKHNDGKVALWIDLGLIGDPSKVRAVATLTSSAGQIYYAGLTAGKGSILIPDPLYWWPKGHGVQNLYRLSVNIYGETDIEDSAELRIGLRTAEAGENGSLFINGVSLLPMGSVFIPDGDPDFTTSDRRVESCVTAAAMSGYNALLIPDGAPTPSDKFFELCDVFGIAVIEEHSSLSEATVASLKNRAHHASLCLIDVVGSSDPNGDVLRLGRSLPDLHTNVVGERQKYIGLPAIPSMKTLRAVIPEDERNLFSLSIESIAEEGAILDMLASVAARYPYPQDLSSFAYASALASAHKVGDAIKSARLTMGESGRPMFYRLRDTELLISPAAIDVRGRWKPLQHYSSRHFSPIALYASASEGRVEFSVSSQRRNECIGSLEYRIADADNKTVYSNSLPVEISPLTSAVIHTADLSEYILGHERDYYLEFYIKEGSSPLSRTTMLFVPEKHFNFKRPHMKTVITGQDRRFAITLSADCFVKDLEIDFDGVDVVLDSNYIDLTSEAPVKIGFTVMGGVETTYHLKDVLELRSVVDLK